MSLEPWHADLDEIHHVIDEGLEGRVVALPPQTWATLEQVGAQFDLTAEQLAALFIEDALGRIWREDYVDGIVEETQLRRLLAARALGQASTLELGQLVRRLEEVAVRNATLVAQIDLVRNPIAEQLAPAWPVLPRPHAGGRPRHENDPDKAWLRTLGQALRSHYRDGLPWTQAYARAGISETQGIEYRRRAGLLDDT